MVSFKALFQRYRAAFRAQNLSPATLKVYLLELCNERGIDLYREMEQSAPNELVQVYEEGVKRLLKGEPLNYVLGYTWFYGYRFLTDKRVLIPRYETEELVAGILAKTDAEFPERASIAAADIGTGSGAIAIALVKEEPKLQMYAVDISADAIALAQRNAALNQANVEFRVGDLLAPLLYEKIKLDILISNPPYIPVNEKIDASVKDYEPAIALFGGEDGLAYYRLIFEKAHLVLKEHAFLAFEIGYDQRERLVALARSYFKTATIDVKKDINGKDRMLFITLNGR